jgi:hypothetical protein
MDFSEANRISVQCGRVHDDAHCLGNRIGRVTYLLYYCLNKLRQQMCLSVLSTSKLRFRWIEQMIRILHASDFNGGETQSIPATLRYSRAFRSILQSSACRTVWPTSTSQNNSFSTLSTAGSEPPHHPPSLSLNKQDRECNFLNRQPKTVAELASLCTSPSSSIIRLTMQALGVRDDAAALAAEHAGPFPQAHCHTAGAAIGLSKFLRGTRHHASRRRVYIPEELTREVPPTPPCRRPDAQYKASLSAVVHLEPSQELSSCAHELAHIIDAEAAQARALTPSLPPAARLALLPLVGLRVLSDASRQRLTSSSPTSSAATTTSHPPLS